LNSCADGSGKAAFRVEPPVAGRHRHRPAQVQLRHTVLQVRTSLYNSVNETLQVGLQAFPILGDADAASVQKQVDQLKPNNEPLPNLFVSMLQRLGIEADQLASSKGTLKGLEMAG
jgi:hypothetical protein